MALPSNLLGLVAAPPRVPSDLSTAQSLLQAANTPASNNANTNGNSQIGNGQPQIQVNLFMFDCKVFETGIWTIFFSKFERVFKIIRGDGVMYFI